MGQVFGALNEPRPHGIPLLPLGEGGRRSRPDEGARRVHQMLLVERDRAEPALKQMAGLARAGVDKAGVEPAPRDSASANPSPSAGVRMR